ncbi:MAG TPA: PilZ domain-containing protein [Myxococcaceae bacterium]|nr:PilZ domain-containing protein [Myxococcaceae bacterium]
MASSYWIGDAEGRVLGPVALDVLQDLVSSGRLQDVTRASADGRRWGPPEQYPEILALLLNAPRPEALLELERQEAGRVWEQLRAMQGKVPHEVFGIEQAASVDAYRNAFFKLVKRFYPDRVRAQAHPDLRRAYSDAFHFLSRLMVHIETELAAGRTVGAMPSIRDTPVPAPAPRFTPLQPARTGGGGPRPALRPLPRGPVAPERPSYQAHEFVGFRRHDDRVEVTVRVTAQNSVMFTQHPLVNLQSGGVFVASKTSLPLGTPVDMVFHFDEPAREIKARGRVILENAGADPRAPVGFGVRLVALPDSEKSFVQAFLQKAASRR